MPITENLEELSRYMAQLKEDAVLKLVHQYLAEGVDPLEIIDRCHNGMIRVGEYYEEGRYFISGLIMAGEIMRQVGDVVFPLLENKTWKERHGDAGCIVLGTIEGDIHFIGKDIFKVLIRGHGFTVHDLGVDVSPGRFLEAIHEFRPDIIGFSCLINSTYKPMKEAITLLKEKISPDISPLAYIIGGRVDSMVCEEVGADYWSDDGMKGVRLCQTIMEKG